MADPENPYVSVEQLKQVLPANARLNPTVLLDWLLEHEEAVARELGPIALPKEGEPGYREVFGIVRNFAKADALDQIDRDGSRSREAAGLRSESNRRLQRLDLSKGVPGEPGESRGVASPEDSVGSRVDGKGQVWGPLDAFTGYRMPPPGSRGGWR